MNTLTPDTTASAPGADADVPFRPIRHVLVPISSVEMARRKAAQVMDLVASAGAVVTVLHVVEPGEALDESTAAPALSHFKRAAISRGVQVEIITRQSDDVVAAIADECAASAADLIVLGEPLPDVASGGRRIVHDVIERVGDDVRVLVVPTTRMPA